MLLVAHYLLEKGTFDKVYIFNPNETVAAQINTLVEAHPQPRGDIKVRTGIDF